MRLCALHVSLHGGSSEVHDAAVGDAAFAQTMAGLQAASGRGLELVVQCVVHSGNLEHLRGVVDAVAPLGDATLVFAPAEPVGAARADGVVPHVADAARAVADALAWADRRGLEGRALHRGFPLCLLPGYERRSLATTLGASLRMGPGDVVPSWVDDRSRIQPGPCRDCALRGGCPGLHRDVFAERGAGSLRPVLAPRSNSFNYVPLGEVAWPEGAPCPVLARGPEAYDPTRMVLVRRGERLRLWHTQTSDFAPAEIRAVARTLGQLYLDVSDKDAPDDFARDLRKLVRLDACEPCPARERCPTAHRVLDDDVFSRDDEQLRAILGGMRGDVLDVGCGDGRYGDVLSSLVADGRVRYRGVDPDAARIEGLARRWPWARLEVGTAEALALSPGSLDHALLLRSYNHLTAPGEVIAALVRALRPGGSLLVADNVAFGLLREPDHAARAERGPAEFEHYRNHGASEAAELLAELPVHIVARTDTGPRTSDQWLLHAVRT
jgi:SAM-dependent methyltransferase